VPLSDTLPHRGDQPRILIVRLATVTDLVMASSLLQSLRDRWPDSHIAWIAQSRPAGLFDGDRRLDALIRVPTDMFRRPATALYLRRELRSQQFDWVIDAQHDRRSRMIARLCPGAVRIGFESEDAAPFMFQHRVPLVRDNRTIASEYRQLARQVTGLPSTPPMLPVSDATREAVRAAMRDLGLEPGFIALCPFTQQAERSWSEQQWMRLVRIINREGLGRCVLFGGAAHERRARQLMHHLPEGTLNLVGETRLLNTPAWMWHASAVVGVDTSMTHIGVAVRRPVIGLFGDDAPYLGGTDSPFECVRITAVDRLAGGDSRRASGDDGPAQVLRHLRRLLEPATVL